MGTIPDDDPHFCLDGSEQKRPNAEDCCCMRVGGKDFDISKYSGSCDLNPKNEILGRKRLAEKHTWIWGLEKLTDQGQ